MLRWLPIAVLAAACSPQTVENFIYVGDDGGIHGDPDAGPVDAGARAICPPDGGWVRLAPIAAGPRSEVSVAELNGEVYVAGGYDVVGYVISTVEAYSWRTDSWRTVRALPRIASHVNMAAYGGKLYALGGLDDSFVAYGSSWVYDPATDDWTAVASMTAGTQRGASAMGIVGNKIVLAGGYRSGSVAQVSAYEPGTDMWTQLPPLPLALDHLVGAVLADTFFAIGGRRGAVNARVDALAMGASSWVSKMPMPTARAGAAAAQVGDTVIVAGGEGNALDVNGIFPQVEVYNLATDSWTTIESWPTKRHGTGGATVDGVAFFPAGAIREGLGPNAANEAWCPAR